MSLPLPPLISKNKQKLCVSDQIIYESNKILTLSNCLIFHWFGPHLVWLQNVLKIVFGVFKTIREKKNCLLDAELPYYNQFFTYKDIENLA